MKGRMPEDEWTTALDGLATSMKLLKEARGYKSKAAFSRATGVDEDTIGLWEKGDRPSISPANAHKLKQTTALPLIGYTLATKPACRGSCTRS